MMKGTYDQVSRGLAPELLAEEAKDPGAREQFEGRQKKMTPMFKGMQIFSKKTLSDEKVELKIRMDADQISGNTQMPEYLIQPMVKIGDEWKLGGSTYGYQPAWDADGQIQGYNQ